MIDRPVGKTESKQPSDFDRRVQKLREIYADATEISKTALENVIRAVQSGGPATESVPMGSAGRIGARRGKVSELTAILPINPSAAKNAKENIRRRPPQPGGHRAR
jgi:hypothetical protein